MEYRNNLVTALTITIEHEVKSFPSHIYVQTIDEGRNRPADICHIFGSDIFITR